MPDESGDLTQAEVDAINRVQEDLKREAEAAERAARENEN